MLRGEVEGWEKAAYMVMERRKLMSGIGSCKDACRVRKRMGRDAGYIGGKFRQKVLGCRALGHKGAPEGFEAGRGLFRFVEV